MGTPASWKIGMALLWVIALTWFPWGANLCPSWWGPAPCLGQTTGTTELNPECLAAVSFSGASFTGCSNIINNTLTERNSHFCVEINHSFQGFTGISQINQAGGSLNNQANVLGIAGASNGGAVAHLSQNSLSHKSRVENNTLNTSGNDHQASITGNSFAGGAGVLMVNQAAGHMNAQLNVINMTIGPKRPLMGLTDTELGAVKANNHVNQDPSGPNKYSTNLEGGKINNFTGLVTTNQVAGNMNQVSTVFNVNVTTLP